MNNGRLNPLNDFLFLKIMGEKGDEEQLLAFLNAVLKRPESGRLQSIEIVENKAIPADIVGGKSCALDVRAMLADSTRANIEVQLKDYGNMDRRSLYYWAREFTKGLAAGHEYEEVPNVIAINIVGYGFLPQIPDFHTTFHIREDTHRGIILTDALEIHFIDMVKFGALGGRDLENNALHRWLVYLDKRSPMKLVEEVIQMDVAIQKAETKMQYVVQDEDALRWYEAREKAQTDWISGMGHAKRQGIAEGEARGKLEIARNLKGLGMPVAQIAQATGLTEQQIDNL